MRSITAGASYSLPYQMTVWRDVIPASASAHCYLQVRLHVYMACATSELNVVNLAFGT